METKEIFQTKFNDILQDLNARRYNPIRIYSINLPGNLDIIASSTLRLPRRQEGPTSKAYNIVPRRFMCPKELFLSG